MNKIEEEFYKAFEIEPRYGCHNDISEEALPCDTACEECAWYWDEFPKITDRILLELICILCKEAYTYYEPFYGTTFEDLKDNILSTCIQMYDNLTTGKNIKHQVQALFKEEE